MHGYADRRNAKRITPSHEGISDLPGCEVENDNKGSCNEDRTIDEETWGKE